MSGVPEAHHALGVATFRVITFWLLLPIGWIALCIGSVGLFGWVFYELVRSEMELLPKVLILSILGGLTILLALTARARLRTLPYDPYRSIQR